MMQAHSDRPIVAVRESSWWRRRLDEYPLFSTNLADRAGDSVRLTCLAVRFYILAQCRVNAALISLTRAPEKSENIAV